MQERTRIDMAIHRNSMTPLGAQDAGNRWRTWCASCLRQSWIDLAALVAAGHGDRIFTPPHRCSACNQRTVHVTVVWTYGDHRDGDQP